jgi:hypothetical protein
MALTETDRRAMGRAAQNFVARNKNPVKQCEKVIEMLRS